MTIREFIKDLLDIEDLDRPVSIVIGDEDKNSIDTPFFELHHLHDSDHPLEIFVDEDCKQYL